MNYELMTLTKGSLGEPKFKEQSKKVAEIIGSLDGKITETDTWGRRKLAYKIRQDTDGFYEVINFELDNTKIDSLKKKLNLENDLIRYLITAKS